MKKVEGSRRKGRGFSKKGSRVFDKRVEGFREKGRGFSEKGSRVFGKRVEGFPGKGRRFSRKGSRVFQERVEGFPGKGRGFLPPFPNRRSGSPFSRCAGSVCTRQDGTSETLRNTNASRTKHAERQKGERTQKRLFAGHCPKESRQIFRLQ